MAKPRITVSGKKLSDVISVWLRKLPKHTWGTDPEYERLRAQKRHDPGKEPDRRREVADHIAAEFERLGWEVSYPEPDAPGSPPPYRGT